MRIIAGTAKGRRLNAPKGMSTRPTADKVREAMFSVLGGHVQQAVVLDAFAGSGALGIEALSRGAECVTFIEKDYNALKVIKANLEAAGLTAQANIICGQSEKVLTALAQPFNLVFLDPPYNKGHIARLEPVLLAPGLLSEDVIIVLETNSKEQELLTDESWEHYKTSVYGDTAVVYYGKKSYKK